MTRAMGIHSYLRGQDRLVVLMGGARSGLEGITVRHSHHSRHLLPVMKN